MVVDKYLKPGLDDEKTAEVLLIKGMSQGRLAQFSEAQEIFEQLVNHKNVLISVQAQNNLSWLYLQQYQLEKNSLYLDLIISICEQTLKQFDRVHDNNLKKKMLVRLGTAYLYQSKIGLALDAYFEANKLVPDDPNVLSNIAVLFLRQRKTEEAREYLETALSECEKSRDCISHAYCYQIFAELMESICDYSQAREYYLLALDYFVEGNLFPQANECLKNIMRLDGVIHGESISILGKKFSENVLRNVGGETHNTLKGLAIV